MRDYDVEITEENGALTLLPGNADGVIELEIDPGPPIEVIETGPSGPPGPTGATGLVKVTHGSNPNVARPAAPLVYWVGTVTPVNALPDDLFMMKT